MTRSGSIGPRRRRWRSSRAACWPSRSRWCSRCVSPSDEPELAGLPELVVGGLGDGDARALLDSAIPGRLDERVRDRIVAETRGNPLALLELPRGLTAAELAGGFGLSRRAAAGEPDRAELPAAHPVAAGRDATAAARGGGRAGRRRDPAVARGRAARDRRGRGGAGRGGGVDRARCPGAVPSSAGALGGLPGGGACVTARRCTARWPRRPIRRPIPIAERGIAPTRRSGPTRRWPPSWSARPTGRRAAAASRRRPRSCERATELTPDPARRGARALAAAQAKFEAGGARRGARAARGRGAGPARRAPARAAGPAARPDRVRPPARE